MDWNSHRFSGGALALDLVNTVIYRGDAARRLDRFADTEEIARFANAAERFRVAEFGGSSFTPPDGESEIRDVMTVREAINGLFREAASVGQVSAGALSAFLACGAKLTTVLPPATQIPLEPSNMKGLPLGAAAFLSGLRLLHPDRLSRVRICPNCQWLYVDESRNRSRRWCDMNVCGNRAKARRHYHRNRARVEEGHGQV